MRSVWRGTIGAAVCAAGLAACDLLPGGRVTLDERATAVADSAAAAEAAAEARPSGRSRAARSGRSAGRADAAGKPTRTSAVGGRVGVGAGDARSDSAAAPPPPPPPPDPALRAMRTDLVNLARAQGEFHSTRGRYTAVRSQLPLYYVPRPGVRIEILSADRERWSARASHDGRPGWDCTIAGVAGRSAPPPVCDTTRSGRHGASR